MSPVHHRTVTVDGHEISQVPSLPENSQDSPKAEERTTSSSRPGSSNSSSTTRQVRGVHRLPGRQRERGGEPGVVERVATRTRRRVDQDVPAADLVDEAPAAGEPSRHHGRARHRLLPVRREHRLSARVVLGVDRHHHGFPLNSLTVAAAGSRSSGALSVGTEVHRTPCRRGTLKPDAAVSGHVLRWPGQGVEGCVRSPTSERLHRSVPGRFPRRDPREQACSGPTGPHG